MPLLGEPLRFAVEYDLKENHGGDWMFGRFCYWCEGRRIGDYELGTSLRDVLFQLEQLPRDRHLRVGQRLNSKSAIDVFRLLNAALFGTADLNNARVAEQEQWARHNILPPVDVFDSWKGFLLEDQQTARFIFAHDPYLDVNEFLLKPGEVYSVLDAALNALSELYERVRGR
jgi:Immunity protein 42